jgi:murein DD-endopeptidase MepM/ murein hydrolase activator NlpD
MALKTGHRISVAAFAATLLVSLGGSSAIAMLRGPSDAAAALSSTPLPPLQVQRTLTLKRGDTLASALKQAGFTPAQVAALTATTPAATKAVSAKTELTLNYTEAQPYQIQQANLTYRPTPVQEVTMVLNGQHASAQVEAKPLRDETATAVGVIRDSLYQDGLEAGLSPSQVTQFMNIFAWDLDYSRDIHPGDSFKILYERTVNDKGERVKTGRILAAEFKVGKETRTAYWFGGEYLDATGNSKRKLLLRTPVDFTRISSAFGMRGHPVLGFTRMHKGTDFAAPFGTPIKASGNGVVVFEGWHGGHGNYLQIKHNGTFTTAYAHISKFAKGIKLGSKVTQGQTIAYVGSTGLSTGPHLHYEVIKNGTFVDAMRTDLPTGSPLNRSQLAQFKALVSKAQVAWNKAFSAQQVASR